MAGNNLNVGLVKFCHFFLKILSVNENLTSIKGQNSVKNLRKITGNNTNLDLVNVHIQNSMKFYPFVLKIFERKRNSVINQGA